MIQRRRGLDGAAATVLAACLGAACGHSGHQTIEVKGAGHRHAGAESFEFLSETYTVDKLYRSMMGPSSKKLVTLLPKEEPRELLWVTGFDAVMVGADGETPMPQEFMCHSNFSVQRTGPQKAYVRLFTLSQGQLSVRFPAGFGIPVMSDEVYSVETQVLNLNYPEGTREVRHSVEVDYVRDRNVERPYKPLFVTHGYVLVTLEEEPVTFGVENPDALLAEACCLPGDAASTDSLKRDEAGNRFSGHFVVPVGRHEYRTLVTEQMGLKYDTAMHQAAIHLHPFAESLELYDMTADRSVYKSQARGFDDKIGLEHVDEYSSEEGLPLFRDHQYQLIAVYDNTSGEPQDSMAVMLMYLHYRDWRPPTE